MVEKRFDVVALGELWVDFTDNGLSEQGNTLFEANPGGAPCNVLAMLKKLGRSCAFVGKVGANLFGQQLRGVVEAAGICMDYLAVDQEARTTLASVKKLDNGDRDFSFYRNPGADMMLTEKDLPLEAIESCRIFHFGTLSMTHEGMRKATCKAINCVKKSGALISFDPNLRPPLWNSLEKAKVQIEYGLAHCDILKIADNELEFMTGETDFDKGAAILRAKYSNIRLFNVTAGADGSYSYYEDKRFFVPACKLGSVIETTGAGGTFCASVLNFVLEHGLEGLAENKLKSILSFANAVAYLVPPERAPFVPCRSVDRWRSCW